MSDPFYMDYASTTPVDPRVVDEMLPYFSTHFGNASSNHKVGKVSKKAIENAREVIASSINAEPNELFFTSGSTEAIYIGLVGAYLANKTKGNHVVAVKTEHKAVLENLAYLESVGARITLVGVNNQGLIDFDEFERSITKETVLVSVMHVNNETGTIQDVDRIGQICEDRGIIFFSDTAQSFGKTNIDVKKTSFSMLCISGHKFNGPKGIGAIYIKSGLKASPVLFGGGQEKKVRPGTYNTPLIVGLGKAVSLLDGKIMKHFTEVAFIQRNVEDFFLSNKIGSVLNLRVQRSPYISSILLNNQDASQFVMMNESKICISTGSACNSQTIEPSHVIFAMTKNYNAASKVVRLSYTWGMEIVNLRDLKLKF